MSAAAPPPALQNVAGVAKSGTARPRHPEWYDVTSVNAKPTLKMMNSLTDELVEFRPRDGNVVKWYTCGPTVYDMSHMGHARAYLTFDILRRIMEDYFGYTVFYQMNITDVDDKIIRKARIGKLLSDYRASDPSFDALVSKVNVASAFVKLGLTKRAEQLAVPLPADAPGRVRDEREEKLKELDLKHGQYAETLQKVEAARAARDAAALMKEATPFLGDLLDDELGGTISDHSIFDGHSRKYEAEFFTDMHRLGVRDPDVISRVTEVVPQIVEFTKRIIDNGFGYIAASSVFFDTDAYTAAGHFYPKLKATAQGSKTTTTEDEMNEGEGSLGAAKAGEKKSPNDFALWKFSKPGEPRWDSPWGRGRPGWHIECSVMASEVLGNNMDVHGGGCDLKFPHHDNEIAQSEAYWGHGQWVNYFLHCGHLHIKGLKMSKSLKNFITIRQALDELKVTPREMRLLFLSNHWQAPMNFSDQALGEARERERQLRSFFGSIDIVLRAGDAHLQGLQGFTADDKVLSDAMLATEKDVHAALCNNFDTPTAMLAILELVKATNAYLGTKGRKSSPLLRRVGRTATRYLQVFGVVEGTDALGFSEMSGSDADGKLSGVLDALVGFRDTVRTCARDKQPSQALLPLCDSLRDETLPPLGIRLEDKPGNGPTQWKLDDPAVLIAELAEKKKAVETERLKKLGNTLETKRKLYDKWAAFQVHPTQYFRHDPAEAVKYAQYDAQGVPTHDHAGTAMDDKKAKKLKKDLEKYEGSFHELVAKGPTYLADLKAEITAIETEVNAAGSRGSGAAAPPSA